MQICLFRSLLILILFYLGMIWFLLRVRQININALTRFRFHLTSVDFMTLSQWIWNPEDLIFCYNFTFVKITVKRHLKNINKTHNLLQNPNQTYQTKITVFIVMEHLQVAVLSKRIIIYQLKYFWRFQIHFCSSKNLALNSINNENKICLKNFVVI